MNNVFIVFLFLSVFNFYPHHQFSNEIHNNIQQDFFFIHSKKEFQSEIYERHQKTQCAKNARIITSKAEINLFRKKNSLHNLAYASKKISKNLNF